ncbi:heavy-metal-associated domain-containing protein [Devosia sp.]|uniref:heavy-metal-associated domain-containing protein n=1 Tax=Devosia sp. TaxID=1871048 RepID=UPI0032669638
MSTEPSTFTVNDMTCSHCVGTLTRALNEALPGAAVEIDLASHKVRVNGDAVVAAEAIREAGYTPEPA